MRFTLLNLLLLLAGVLGIELAGWAPTWALALPALLLAVNLAAAIVDRPVFRRNLPLLIFHLALLAILLLAAAGRLTYLQGWVGVAEGTEFDGALDGYAAGPWHPWRIADVRFKSEWFELDYLPNTERDRALLDRTRNRVAWSDEQGREVSSEIGDNTPLVLQGYRFYTTSANKGFAPAFSWRPRGEEVAAEAVALLLPRYPDFEFEQAREWRPTGLAEPLWVMLEFDDTVLATDRPTRFRLPGEHRVIIRYREARHALRPGDRLELEAGELVYHELRRWLGYDVRWDETLWWLLAASAVAVISLGWHFAAKFRNRSWLQPD